MQAGDVLKAFFTKKNLINKMKYLDVINLIKSGKIKEAIEVGEQYFSKNNPEIHKKIILIGIRFRNIQNEIRVHGKSGNHPEMIKIAEDLLNILKERNPPKNIDKESSSRHDLIESEIDNSQTNFWIQELRKFCRSAKGFWISIGSDIDLVGFLQLKPDKAQITIELKGEAFNRKGEKIYEWNTIASAIDLEEEKLNYIWEGNVFDLTPGDPIRRARDPKNKGWGEINFKTKVKGKYEFAHGKFFDTELADSTKWKHSNFKRFQEKDMITIYMGNPQEIATLVNKLLG